MSADADRPDPHGHAFLQARMMIVDLALFNDAERAEYLHEFHRCVGLHYCWHCGSIDGRRCRCKEGGG